MVPEWTRKYGMVDGVVKTVSADAQQQDQRSTTDPNTQPLAFRAIIGLEKQTMGSLESSLLLEAGMSVSAEIIQDQRTVFEYLLSPVQRIASEAGRER
jgi:multidrug efflux pump subunit AcrA (membrane-fusion protein)